MIKVILISVVCRTCNRTKKGSRSKWQ